MGTYERIGEDLIYRQDSGEVTARLLGFEEKTELAHVGSGRYKTIFYLLVTIGLGYLVIVFATH